MDYTKALEELEIEYGGDLNPAYLRKVYRKQALRYHPDKNGNTPESTRKFQKINEAHDFLKREIEDTEEEDFPHSSLYLDMVKAFLKSVFQNNPRMIEMIKEILNGCKKQMFSFHTTKEKETALEIYQFLSKYKNIFHLDSEWLDQLREKVIQKYENVMEVYKLNPSIDDLMQNNLFKLVIEETLYLVPLWYNESQFIDEKTGREILVLCEPELPDHITLDEDNQLHVSVRWTFSEMERLFLESDTPVFPVHIGKKVFEIPLEKIVLKNKQIVRIKGMGLTKVSATDIYDVLERGDILVHFQF